MSHENGPYQHEAENQPMEKTDTENTAEVFARIVRYHQHAHRFPDLRLENLSGSETEKNSASAATAGSSNSAAAGLR
jgi:hypothetical protein